jgi:hypothetical protein
VILVCCVHGPSAFRLCFDYGRTEMTFYTKGDDRNWTLKSISWVGRERLGTLKGEWSDTQWWFEGNNELKQLYIYLKVLSGAKQRRLVHCNVPKELSVTYVKLKHSQQRDWRILCFVDRASFYNLVNKTNLVHNSFFVCLFLFCTWFGQLCAHHQEE